MSYDSTVFAHPEDVTSYEERHIEAYQKVLEESFVTDRKQGFTSVGPHRDDLSFTAVRALCTALRLAGTAAKLCHRTKARRSKAFKKSGR